MRRNSFWHRAFYLYYDGFRSMTLGRTLWLVIGIKLFIIFAVLKVFFFPNFIKQHAEKGHEAEFVAKQLGVGSSSQAKRRKAPSGKLKYRNTVIPKIKLNDDKPD